MTTQAIRNEHDRARAIKLIESRAMPFTLNITKGAPRSIEQNRTQRMWLLEAEEQGDQTAEEYRGYCKLHFGCAILYNENEEFAQAFDDVIRPLSYENKLKVMMIPLNMPVTSIMTTKQKTKYLEAEYQFLRGLGFELTEPER